MTATEDQPRTIMEPSPDNKPTEKILRELKRQAQYLTARIQGQYQAHNIKSWADTEAMFGIEIPGHFKNLPFNYSGLSLFYQYWVSSYELRLTPNNSSGPDKKLTVAKPSNCSSFASITLRPRQQPVFEELYNNFFKRGERAQMQDGGTGCGKTYVAAALIARRIAEGVLDDPLLYWRLHPFIIFCPSAVAEKWRRALEAFGLGHYVATRKILIFESSGFSNFLGKVFLTEDEDIHTQEVTTVWNETMIPYFTVIDECHEYVRRGSSRTKGIEALCASDAEHILFMSATPIECVNDAYIFLMAMKGFNWQGMKINKSNFEIFAQWHDANPGTPNASAVKRLRETLSSYIVSMPYAKPKHKAVNIIQIVDFKSPEHRAIYDSAIERYYEVCRKVGKDPNAGGRFKKAIALNKLRHSVEPLRGWFCARQAANNYHSGQFSTIIGCAFKETIATILFELIDSYHIPRSAVSVIWGGRKDIKQVDVLPPEQLSDVLKTLDVLELQQNPEMLKKLKLTLKYRQDQLEHGEDAAQQLYRHDKLREFKLTGTQSKNSRQVEIDRFQTGVTKICIMTVDTGGVGLDLDRKTENVWPRDCYFTQIYSGRKFLQLLGRSVREDSISDANQYLLMMRDTVEEYHVAPILEAKLQSNTAFTNRTFDIAQIIEQTDVPKVKLRTAEEAAADLDKAEVLPLTAIDNPKEDDEEDEDEEL